MTTPMSIRKLRQKVIAVDKREDKNWATSLSERKLKEVLYMFSLYYHIRDSNFK